MPTLEDGVRSWPTWLSAKSPRNRPQELMRLWIQGVDRGWPGWENQEAQCRNCKRKTGDDGHHRHVFPGGDRCCARIVCSNSPRKNTKKSLKKEAQLCVILLGVFWVSDVCFLPAIFSAHRMFDCLRLFQHTALQHATVLCHLCIYTRLPVRWVVDCTWKE